MGEAFITRRWSGGQGTKEMRVDAVRQAVYMMPVTVPLQHNRVYYALGGAGGDFTVWRIANGVTTELYKTFSNAVFHYDSGTNTFSAWSNGGELTLFVVSFER